jgi:hypothetical protein
MNKRHTSFTLFNGNKRDSAPSESRAASFAHPDDVVSDTRLNLAEKRAILASWVSDVRAVENAPALRRLDSGAIVAVDDILQALNRLDRAAGRPRSRAFFRQDGRVIWLRRPEKRNDDNDDDPPPAPAGMTVPLRPTRVAAYGAAPVGMREAVFAAG